MINDAIEKIEFEAANSGDAMMKMLCQQIIENVKSEQIAEKILAKDKTLAGCKKAFDNYASKNRKGSQSIIDPQKAEELIYEYFAIDKETDKKNRIGIVNILDFIKR